VWFNGKNQSFSRFKGDVRVITLSLRAAAVLGLLAMLPFQPAPAQAPAKAAPKETKSVDQGDNDPRLKGYFTPEGVKVEIVAEAPLVVNPVALTFGDDGTAYVLEWHSNARLAEKKGKDVVKVLHDTQNKRVYDRAKVVLEEDMPSSLLLHDDWLYLCGRGTVRRYRLSALGRQPKAEIIARGFGGVGHHQVSGLTIGNDGWLYISTGAGDHHVEGSDGCRATVLRTGAIFRCRPDGSRLQTFAIGFCNPYRDVVFDATGNMFHADNDGSEGERFTGCRLLHIAEGCDFGWRQRPGARACQPDLFRTAINAELPGKMPPLVNTGRGAASGLFLYNDTRFPEPYRGPLYYPDVVRKSIRTYRVEPKGASFTATEELTFLKSDDPLFRPCQVTAGPDGAMYIVDWRTDASGGLAGDGEHGRIYRVTWTGTKEQAALPPRPMDSWLKVIRQSDDDLLKTLAGEDGSDRTRAQRELVRRGERNRAALLRLLRDGEQPLTARLAALGAVEAFWNEEVQKAFQQTLADAEDPLRCRAAEALGLLATRGNAEVHDSLLKALNDSSLAVRRAVALAMGRIAAPGSADALVNTLAFDDSGDVYLRDGLLRAIEGLGKPGIERLLALAESGVQKDTDRVVHFFAALRTQPAYQGLPVLLKYPHLTVAQRMRLIRSCGNYLLDPPISLDPILAFLANQPEELKRAGAELLAACPEMVKKSRK
jgi:quinoprotein glucose dehydrogenase